MADSVGVTPEKIAEWKAKHAPYVCSFGASSCPTCGIAWPCPVAALIEALEKAQRGHEAAQETGLAVVRKLEAAEARARDMETELIALQETQAGTLAALVEAEQERDRLKNASPGYPDILGDAY